MTQTTVISEGPDAPASKPNTLHGAGPWIQPELKANPDQTLDLLRETKHMINSLVEREKKLKAELQKMHENGELDPFVSDDNDRKFVGLGISVTLVPGKQKRTWSSSVQKQLSVIEKEKKKVEAEAEYKGEYTVEQGAPSWRVNLEAEL